MILGLVLILNVSFTNAQTREDYGLLPRFSQTNIGAEFLKAHSMESLDIMGEFELCQNANTLCNSLTGNPSCIQNGSQLSKVQIARRWRQVKKWFEGEFLVDDSALSLCCKNNASCKDYLKQTKLVLSDDAITTSLRGRYDFQSRSILISENHLSECSNFECLEEIVLHEFGHTCQAATYETNSIVGRPFAALMRGLQVTGRGVLTSGTAGFENVVSEKKADCIRISLDLHAAEYKRNGRMYSATLWSQEANADAVFASALNTPFHWAFRCNAEGGFSHAQREAYLRCLFIKD